MLPDPNPPAPAPAPKRRRLEAADAREAILAAAEALLVERGPDGLRLTEVATRAGVSHPNVLYHFGTVAELQTQLAQRVTIRLAEEVAHVYEGEDPLALSVERVVAKLFRVFDEGGYARLIAWLTLSTNTPTYELLAEKLEIVRRAIAEHPALRGAEFAERRRRIVPAIELVIFAAIGYGLTGATVEGFFAPDSERVDAAQLLGSMLRGPERGHAPHG
ncbi:MAG: TetR/AcrR family transcriptional regulator [Vulcanimicrobiaceae bacterium]